MRRFHLGDRVRVETLYGEVVEIVPAGKRPTLRVDENVIRDHESYVVIGRRRVLGETGKQEHVVWPRVIDILPEVLQ